MAFLESPMSGKIFQINVNPGDAITPDDEPIVLDSMKMEIPVTVDNDCTVVKIIVVLGQNVNAGDHLLEIN